MSWGEYPPPHPATFSLSLSLSLSFLIPLSYNLSVSTPATLCSCRRGRRPSCRHGDARPNQKDAPSLRPSNLQLFIYTRIHTAYKCKYIYVFIYRYLHGDIVHSHRSQSKTIQIINLLIWWYFLGWIHNKWLCNQQLRRPQSIGNEITIKDGRQIEMAWSNLI